MIRLIGANVLTYTHAYVCQGYLFAGDKWELKNSSPYDTLFDYRQKCEVVEWLLWTQNETEVDCKD